MSAEELLDLIDSIVNLVEFECGVNTEGEKYKIPDEDDPEYEKYRLFNGGVAGHH